VNIVVGMIVVGAAGLVAWAAAPWVSMGRRGTVDGRTLAACRMECVVPAPRRSVEDLGPRERGIRLAAAARDDQGVTARPTGDPIDPW
jgi:hypothetical protein